MEMIPVQSSQIAEVGHDPAAALLHIRFRRGELYEYENVSAEEHAEMMSSSSVGAYFTSRIKGSSAHPFRKVATDGLRIVEDHLVERHVVLEAEESTTADVEQVKEQSTEITVQAKAVSVIDVWTQQVASDLLLSVAAMRAKVASTFKPMKDAAFKAHRTVCDQEKLTDAPLLEAESYLKRQISAFVSAERERARQEEERLRREERERAEREAKEESERLALEDALQLEEEGEHEAAEAALASPLPVAPRYVPPPPVAPHVAQVAGVSMRQTYKWRVIDEKLVPRQYLCLDEKAIGGVVRAMGAKTNIPGIEVYPETTVAASRRG